MNFKSALPPLGFPRFYDRYLLAIGHTRVRVRSQKARNFDHLWYTAFLDILITVTKCLWYLTHQFFYLLKMQDEDENIHKRLYFPRAITSLYQGLLDMDLL